jgi:hypothetical protein
MEDVNITVCPLHGEMDKKITTVLTNQLTYMQRQADTSAVVDRIEHKVDNGLTSAVVETKEQVQALHDKITVLEDFGWFREWVTDLRNNVFKYLLKWAFVGGAISIGYVVLMIYGQKFMVRFMG